MHKSPIVYLAGPILGLSEGQAKDWRKAVGHQLSQFGITAMSPLRSEPAINGSYLGTYNDPLYGTPRAIFSKNFLDTMNCDMVLAYHPKQENVSVGTIIEIGWAYALRKPVILVSDDPRVRDHPLPYLCASWVLDDLEQAVDLIVGTLGGYVTGGRNV